MNEIHNTETTKLVEKILDFHKKHEAFKINSIEDLEKYWELENGFFKTCIKRKDTPTLLGVCRDRGLIEYIFEKNLVLKYEQNKVTKLIDELMQYYCRTIYFIHLPRELNLKKKDILRWEQEDDIDSFINAIRSSCPDIYLSLLRRKFFGENIIINKDIFKKAQEEANKHGLDVTIFIENLITNNLKKIKRSNEKKNICK